MVFCIVGTEEETGRDGAGDMSTGVESESVVRRRRAVVTRRLVPLAGGPSIVFLRPTRARQLLVLSNSQQLLEKAFDEGILCYK